MSASGNTEEAAEAEAEARRAEALSAATNVKHWKQEAQTRSRHCIRRWRSFPSVETICLKELLLQRNNGEKLK
jgi:hypothetical protein